MKKILLASLCILFFFVCNDTLADGEKIGVSMPTKDLHRWNQAGENLKSLLEEAGYEVDLQFAANDVQQQINQVTNMINNGCKVVVIAAIEGSSLNSALDLALEKEVVVIAYERLLMESEAVSYYVTFDNYKVGVLQGTYIKDSLDIDNAAGPFNLEISAGDPGDIKALYFYQGAMDVLQPYLDAGKLIVKSGQVLFADVATPVWKTEVAYNRATSILYFYRDGSNVDAWLCSNDSIALGVINALEDNYDGQWPVITGLDCNKDNVKKMIEGKQGMSVLEDTRALNTQIVRMVNQILTGQEVDVNDKETYNNSVITVPSFLCDPVVSNADNYVYLLIDSGYISEDDIKILTGQYISYQWLDDYGALTAMLYEPDGTIKLSETIESITETITEPTCEEKGYITYQSGEFEYPRFQPQSIKVENADALGHTEVIDEAVPPTCMELGKTEGSHCSVCGKILVEPEEVPVIEHQYELDKETAATCTEPALSAGFHCPMCGKVFVAQQETAPALGHDWGDFRYAWSDENQVVVYAQVCKRDESHLDIQRSLHTLVLPAQTRTVGEEAFAGLRSAEAVYLPETVSFIAADAFDHSMIIAAPEGSYALEWAQEKGFEYITVRTTDQ